MEVICLHDAAFYALIDKVVTRIREELQEEDAQWVSDDEAMRLLGIKSKTTLQKFRDEGRIRFSQPEKKIILYDRHSINELLNKHARDTF
ncbi:MAG: helix-turn-helix domain-containing protein [Bacteroidota bacterium]|jgi:hypothetical protein